MIDARHAALAAALWLAVAPLAGAQVLYKLIDRKGKVSYVDKVPAGFDGDIVKLEADVQPTPEAPRKPVANAPAAAAPDQRRAQRDDLEKALRAAQARLEAARKAKEGGENMSAEEMQYIQRRYPLPRRNEAPPRANCMARQDADGNGFLICPTPVPNEDYYARQKGLEDEVKSAEEALAVAERNYRRGTD